jgi:hypothetical protein
MVMVAVQDEATQASFRVLLVSCSHHNLFFRHLKQAVMSDDFEGSDLTDLEDETYNELATPSQKKKIAKAGDANAYQVRGALKAPRTTTISARSLHGMLTVAN